MNLREIFETSGWGEKSVEDKIRSRNTAHIASKKPIFSGLWRLEST